MDDIYLNKDKKTYYYSDFIEFVLPETNSSWKLGDIIKPYLTILNECETIQPLYSMFPNSGQSESYLEFAYCKDIELVLFRQTLPYFINKYTLDNSKCYYTFSHPKDNPNFFPGKKYNSKLGCRINPEYFRINHIRLTFNEYNKDRHEEFWKDLTNRLKDICLP